MVSYSQIGDDYRAVRGLVKPLIKGVSSPKGLAFDRRHNRLFVADPGLRRIRAWQLYLERCFTPAEKAGLLGAAVSDPFTTDAAEGPGRCDLPWVLHASQEVTVVSDVSSEWVSLDQKGNLYYSDSERKSVNKIDAWLLLNLVHGEITPAELKRRNAARSSKSLEKQGKEAMEVKSQLKSLAHSTEVLGNMAFGSHDDDTSILELFQAQDSQHVATPAGVASDGVQVYWANQDHGLQHGSVATGFVSGSLPSSKLATESASTFGIAATSNMVLFSNGAGVYGVPKFGGGNATAMNEGFVIARGLAWDGSGTVFVADEGASTVYAMPCGVLVAQPLQPVLQMHGAFGLALVQPTDPLVSARSAAADPTFPLWVAISAVWAAVWMS
ncbi:unnamed protein product [Durusdinium trenchii]